MDWLEVAKSLPCGKTIRQPCCAKDNSMLVSHSDRGYSCYCFRCGNKQYKSHGKRSVSDVLRHREELKTRQSRDVFLPSDFTLDIPKHAMQWFLKAGISPEVARKDGLGYSPTLDRICMPVWSKSGELIAVQNRAVQPNQRPKYLNPTGPHIRSALYWSEPPEEIAGREGVIVEDRLSAIKVGQIMPTVCLLGTTMTDERVVQIAKHLDTAYVWLDPDAGGDKALRKVKRQLQMQGVKVKLVVSEKDPKYYTRAEIKDYLRKAE